MACSILQSHIVYYSIPFLNNNGLSLFPKTDDKLVDVVVVPFSNFSLLVCFQLNRKIKFLLPKFSSRFGILNSAR